MTEPIKIPIEIDTVMSKELQKTIKDLKKLNKENKKAKDKTSSQAVPTLEDKADRRGGIFGGHTGVKLKPKDKKSRQAVIRKNEFKKVKDELSALEKANKKVNEKIKPFQGLLGFAGSGIGGGIIKMATRLLPFMMPLMIAKGLIDLVMTELFRDGGVFDRRLDIRIGKQYFKLTNRKEAKQLSEGYGTLRVTTRAGLRGPTTQIFNPQQLAKRGIPFLSEDQERLSKNVF